MSSEEILVARLISAAGSDQDEADFLLQLLDRDQLRAVVLDLAARLYVPPVANEGTAICKEAARLAAAAFKVDPEQLITKDRRKPVVDARAVAQSAARNAGLSLLQIGAHFDQHHTSVLYALQKVLANPDLEQKAYEITNELIANIAPPVAA